MRIPKKYGESQLLVCPFCYKHALSKNKQGIPVCSTHAKQELSEMLCSCKNPLELRKGKWGPYFNCIRCGNQNFKRVLEMRQVNTAQQPLAKSTNYSKTNVATEIHITTDDAQWFE